MADISSTFSSLNSTESNAANGPSGSTTIGSGLDENIRMGMAHVAAWRDQTSWGILTLTSVAGTNTITATLATAGSTTFGPTALTAGMKFLIVPANTTTGAATLNITSPNGGSALGAKNIFANGAANVAGELKANVPAILEYDGTQFNILGPSYAEGTWTPVLTFATAGDLSVAYAANGQLGSYVKSGKLVTIICDVTTSTFTWSTSSGNLQITGLPFAAKTQTGYSATGVLSHAGLSTSGALPTPAVASAASLMTFAVSTGTPSSITSIATGNTTSGTQITLRAVISYEAAS